MKQALLKIIKLVFYQELYHIQQKIIIQYDYFKITFSDHHLIIILTCDKCLKNFQLLQQFLFKFLSVPIKYICHNPILSLY